VEGLNFALGVQAETNLANIVQSIKAIHPTTTHAAVCGVGWLEAVRSRTATPPSSPAKQHTTNDQLYNTETDQAGVGERESVFGETGFFWHFARGGFFRNRLVLVNSGWLKFLGGGRPRRSGTSCEIFFNVMRKFLLGIWIRSMVNQSGLKNDWCN